MRKLLAQWMVLTAAGLLCGLWSPADAQSPTGRWLVRLAGAPAAEFVAGIREDRARASALTESRISVRAAQRRIRARLEAAGIQVVDVLDTIDNALVVESGETAIQSLGTLQGVAGVYPILEYRRERDAAAVLERVDTAFAWLGRENAGRGAKIAILDSGIDTRHPAFQDATLPMPPGFPRGTSATDRAYATNKVIVVRNYERYFPDFIPTASCPVSPADRSGHGTAVAMVAAGVRVAAPRATISGVAPGAYLGAYKIFPGCDPDSTTRTDVILRAMEDAVLDGMTVINLSLGSQPSLRTELDIFNTVLRRMAALGVVVVQSAGNDGPGYGTLSGNAKSSPYTIAVGASANARTFQALATVNGISYTAQAGSGLEFSPVTALLRDADSINGNSLACASFPVGSLLGAIALIERGTCTFETKLMNASRAGAVGAILFTDDREVAAWTPGQATLPAVMIERAAGLSLRNALASGQTMTATIGYASIPTDADRLASFSSRGPGAEGVIKPDLTATGQSIYMADTEDLNPGGYQVASGTSFSSPAVAGAVAVLQSLRPGLSFESYRSLLVNTAGIINDVSGSPLPVMQQGGGRLNLESALRSTLVANPSALNYGFGSSTFNLAREFTVTNLGLFPDTYLVTVSPRNAGPAPLPSETSFTLAPGESRRISLRFASTAAAAGVYDGWVLVRGTRPGADIHIPYYYGVDSPTAVEIAILGAVSSGSIGQRIAEAILLRVNNSALAPIVSPLPTVSAVSGGGAVMRVYSLEPAYPGVIAVDVRLGTTAGNNVFRITHGAAQVDITIAAN